MGQLEGRRVLVTTGGMPLGRHLADGMKRHGARVLEIRAALDDRAQAEAALGAAADDLGGVDLVVHASATAAALKPRAIHTLETDDWQAAVHRSVLATLYCLQVAHARQQGKGGAVVVIGPSVALVGAAQFAPLVTLAEAQRTLVKSAARQWGGAGLRINWVGIAPALYDASLADVPWPQTPELGPPPPALHRRPEPQADVADAIAWLGSEGASAVTGATINLDGGDWMVP